MSKTPHIYRRKNVLYFRMSVPVRLRIVLKVSELTQSLNTQDRKEAIPAVYKLAGEAKALFQYLDSTMSNHDDYELNEAELDEIIKSLSQDDKLKVAEKKNHSLWLRLRQEHARSQVKLIRHNMEIEQLKDEAEEQSRTHKKELEFMRVKTNSDALDKHVSLFIAASSSPQQNPINAQVAGDSAPLLSVVFSEFLKGHPTNQSKLKTFEKLFVGFVGDRSINQFSQIEVNEFFFLLVKCPGGRGGKTDAFNELSIYERVALAEKNSDELIGLGTFKNTYVGAATQFFKWLNLKYAGIAPVLTTIHINYKDFGGLRAKGEDKQRALHLSEIEKLISGFVINPKTEHKFWLIMIALFTGSRVNEICQLNPQHDVIFDHASEIWYFNLTDETAGVGVDGSLKNIHSERKVPIHSRLIECGFLSYYERIKALGHDRIFIKFKPKGGKASYNAEEFFRKYLVEVGLYDNKTKGRKVLGMHSLRGTFMSHTARKFMDRKLSYNQSLSKIKPIVGHSSGMVDENGNDLSQTDGYIDPAIVENLVNKLADLKSVIETLDYGIEFPIAL